MPGTDKPQAQALAELERKIEGPSGSVRSVAVSPNGRWLASGRQLARLEGQESDVCSVAISPDGRRLVVPTDIGNTWVYRLTGLGAPYEPR